MEEKKNKKNLENFLFERVDPWEDIGYVKGKTYLDFGEEYIRCGKWSKVLRCSEGHTFAQKLVCGREWCPSCSQDFSPFHKRRIANLIDRVFSMNELGYLVITVPPPAREFFKDPKILSQVRKDWTKYLREKGIKKGVSRWHFFGSGKIHEDEKLNFMRYHPHLNLLIESAKLDKKTLNEMRDFWREWLNENFNLSLRKTVIWYQYIKLNDDDNEKEMKRKLNLVWHRLKYITRPTFKRLLPENRRFAMKLFKFKNTSWFGKFDREKGKKRFLKWLELLSLEEKEKDDVSSIYNKILEKKCPHCQKELKYGEIVDTSRVRLFLIKEYDCGIFEFDYEKYFIEDLLRDEHRKKKKYRWVEVEYATL
jgi:hypothetical protein